MDCRRKVPTPAEGAALLHVFWKMRDDYDVVVRPLLPEEAFVRYRSYTLSAEEHQGREERQLNHQDHGRHGYPDELGKRGLIYDGAMGTSLEAPRPMTEDLGGWTHEDCLDYLVISKPEIIERVHSSFFEAWGGCRIAADQLIPEQSKAAKLFSVGASRVKQLMES